MLYEPLPRVTVTLPLPLEMTSVSAFERLKGANAAVAPIALVVICKLASIV